jgi:hypothetical protein
MDDAGGRNDEKKDDPIGKKIIHKAPKIKRL